ncbi:MAG: membrane lipoprotein lipid attachment site-containing protein [Spirochaetaceae bacterium]|nr:membrane lipoprotein lipid attachment site-containing protein [Spirochaetaceae bacterium]
MKKIFLILTAALVLSSCEKKNAPQSAQGGTAEQIPADETVAQEPVYKFVNTLDGLICTPKK